MTIKGNIRPSRGLTLEDYTGSYCVLITAAQYAKLGGMKMGEEARNLLHECTSMTCIEEHGTHQLVIERPAQPPVIEDTVGGLCQECGHAWGSSIECAMCETRRSQAREQSAADAKV